LTPARRTAIEHLSAGRPDLARGVLQAVLTSRPGDAECLELMPRVLAALDQWDAAEVFEGRARAAGLDSVGLRDVGARLAERRGEWDRARELLRDGPTVWPHDPAAWLALSDHLVRSGRQDQAAPVLEGALAQIGEEPGLLLALVYARNVAGGVSPGDERALHERLAATLPAGPAPAFENGADPERVMRVAILSADLRLHSCAFFLEGWLPHLDPGQVALHLYSTTREPDGVSGRFRAMAPWRDVSRAAPADLAAAARADAIDILIDANGWTAPGHMRAMVGRVAPVQATYLGYPATTGLGSIDYRFVDGRTDPPGSEPHSRERLVRLDPCLWCFDPDPAWPEPAPRAGGAVTFGSFNHAAKIGPDVVGAWAEILRRCPGSRLVLKSPRSGPTAHAARFAEAGVDPARIEVLSHSADTGAHLGAYARIDVALDPFPYNGTTTTFEALWMGVPLVTLAGDRHRARVGASILGALGLHELIGGDAGDYAVRAAALAQDAGRLDDYRATLRGRLSGSALVDGRGYAAEFTRALRGMWRGWCGGRR
jgi:protein O-GlcNAc transferase